MKVFSAMPEGYTWRISKRKEIRVPDSAVLITERKGVCKQDGRIVKIGLQETKKSSQEKFDRISVLGLILEIFMTF